MINYIYPLELQINKANVPDTHFWIYIYLYRMVCYIVIFLFLDGDVTQSTSYGVYISQLIHFARVSSHVDDFNTRIKVLTAKLVPKQGYRYL